MLLFFVVSFEFCNISSLLCLGQPTLSGDTSVVINLEDVNDNRPELAIPNIEDLTVLENSEIGTLVFKATAEDRDQGLNGLVCFIILWVFCVSFIYC